MKSFRDLVAAHAKYVNELMPWGLEHKLANNKPPIILDIRETEEFNTMHIHPFMSVPRGILESACDYDYSETILELAKAREKEIVVVCRSGNRSGLAAFTMQQMCYKNVASLKTRLKGWNDYEQPLVNKNNEKVNANDAEIFLSPTIK